MSKKQEKEEHDDKGHKDKEHESKKKQAFQFPALAPTQIAIIVLVLVLAVGASFVLLNQGKQLTPSPTPSPITGLSQEKQLPPATIKIFYDSGYDYLPNATRTAKVANEQVADFNITFEAVDVSAPDKRAALMTLGLTHLPVVVIPSDAVKNSAVQALVDQMSSNGVLNEVPGGYAVSYFYMFFNTRKPESSIDVRAADHISLGTQCLNQTTNLDHFFDYDSFQSRNTYHFVQDALFHFNGSVNYKIWWTPVSDKGFRAAKAGYCMQKIDPNFGFGVFNQRMIDSPVFTDGELALRAQGAGVSQEQFESCYKSNETEKIIRKSFDDAVYKYGVPRLPMFMVDCKYIFAPLSENYTGELVNRTCLARPDVCKGLAPVFVPSDQLTTPN
ncbi:MAG TPA: hypothetical protein VGQ00_04275 [Candidatus Norongarragalinales archaeon]|jgi:hypothetical protein|nr:hypothetical protein [Candidatus Norongarragalinales archaeon]